MVAADEAAIGSYAPRDEVDGNGTMTASSPTAEEGQEEYAETACFSQR